MDVRWGKGEKKEGKEKMRESMFICLIQLFICYHLNNFLFSQTQREMFKSQQYISHWNCESQQRFKWSYLNGCFKQMDVVIFAFIVHHYNQVRTISNKQYD